MPERDPHILGLGFTPDAAIPDALREDGSGLPHKHTSDEFEEDPDKNDAGQTSTDDLRTRYPRIYALEPFDSPTTRREENPQRRITPLPLGKLRDPLDLSRNHPPGDK